MKTLLLWMGILLIPVLSRTQDICNFSGLIGNSLKQVNNLNTISSASYLFSEGSITSLKVRCDHRDYLKLVIHYKGFASAQIEVKLLDEKRNIQNEFQILKGDLGALQSPLELHFQPDEAVELKSSKYILVSFYKEGNHFKDEVRFLYQLNKNWNTQLKTEGSIIPLRSNISLNQKELRSPAIGKLDLIYTKIPDSIDTNPIGPSNQPFTIIGNMELQSDVNPFQHIRIYEDKNPFSRYFYYRPREFSLQWRQDRGYGLKILYGNSEEEKEGGNVHVHASMTSGISSRDLRDLKRILSLVKGFEENVTLKPLPFSKSPNITFSDDLYNLYDIPKENIKVQAFTDFSKPLKLSFQTDSRTVNEISIALTTGAGIHGTLLMQPIEDSFSQIEIPIELRLDSPKSLGGLDLPLKSWRQGYLKNDKPFPIKVGKLNLLLLELGKSGKYESNVYSWEFGGELVPPKARMYIKRNIPSWIDKHPLVQRLWISYTVPECQSCNQEILGIAIDGLDNFKEQEVLVESTNSLKSVGAKSIEVIIKAKQFSRGGGEGFLPTVNIIKDNHSYSVGKVYVPSGELPLVRYRLRLIMPDGREYNSHKWVSTTSSHIYIGLSKIKELFREVNIFKKN